jgi:hypothetical protein
MGRGNRKKNKGGNVAVCESEVCTVSDNISINVNDLNDGFEKVVKNIKKNTYAKSIENKSKSDENKTYTSVTTPYKIENTSIDDKRFYIYNFMNNYWSIVNRYHKTKDIIVEPDSDNEEDYYEY